MAEKVEAVLRGLIERAQHDLDVLGVIVFGSRARGDAGPRSDIDVCLVLEPRASCGIAASRRRLEYLAGREIDLAIFQQLPLYLRHRILKEGRVLFVRDEDRLYDLAVR